MHIHQANADDEDPTIARAVESGRDLLALSLLVNQTVGDALSILLLVVVALRRRGWTLEDWAGIYRDLPSRQSVRSVADRSVIVTADAERRVARPAALQPAIDAAVAAAPQGAMGWVSRVWGELPIVCVPHAEVGGAGQRSRHARSPVRQGDAR